MHWRWINKKKKKETRDMVTYSLKKKEDLARKQKRSARNDSRAGKKATI